MHSENMTNHIPPTYLDKLKYNEISKLCFLVAGRQICSKGKMLICRGQQKKLGDESALLSVILSSADCLPDSQVTPTAASVQYCTMESAKNNRHRSLKSVQSMISYGGGRVQSRADPREICGRKRGTGTGLPPITVGFLYQYVSRNSVLWPLSQATFVWRKSGRRVETFKESNALSDVSMEQWTERRFRMISASERYLEHSLNKTTVETLGSFSHTTGYLRWRRGRTPKHRRELSWEAARCPTWVACINAQRACTSLTGRTFSTVAPNTCGSSLLSLFIFAVPTPRILSWLLGFWNFCVSSALVCVALSLTHNMKYTS